MPSSYYVTFGTDRLTFGGPTGSVAWNYEPGYSETLLWKGKAASGTLSLSGQPSAYDVIRIVPGGDNQGNNSLLWNPLEVTYKQISSTPLLAFENPMFGTTAASGVTNGWYFGGYLSGCSGSSWGFAQGYGKIWSNTTGRSIRYDYAIIREIWGIKYG